MFIINLCTLNNIFSHSDQSFHLHFSSHKKVAVQNFKALKKKVSLQNEAIFNVINKRSVPTACKEHLFYNKWYFVENTSVHGVPRHNATKQTFVSSTAGGAATAYCTLFHRLPFKMSLAVFQALRVQHLSQLVNG